MHVKEVDKDALIRKAIRCGMGKRLLIMPQLAAVAGIRI
jgi:hypothetical protein